MSTKKNILLTGGRAPATLHLARLFAKARHNVYVAESMKHHISKFSKAVIKNFHVPNPRQNTDKYIQALVSIVRSEHIDILIPTCEEIFYIAKNADLLNEYCTVFADNHSKLMTLHNKWEFISSVKSSEIHTPLTWIVYSQDELKGKLTLMPKDTQKFILKPVYSRFSSKAKIISKTDLNIQDIDISQNNPWIIQEFINGQQLCTYSIVKNGRIFAHTAYPTKFTAGMGSSINFEHKEYPEVFNWISEYVQEKNFTGQIAFDFIQTSDDKTYVIECNPRSTSGIHLFEQVDFAEAFLEENKTLINSNKSTKAMIALAMITYGLSSLKTFKGFINWLKVFIFSKDIIFSAKDPLPFIHQFYIFGSLGLTAIKNKIKIIEVSTMDIEWNGES